MIGEFSALRASQTLDPKVRIIFESSLRRQRAENWLSTNTFSRIISVNARRSLVFIVLQLGSGSASKTSRALNFKISESGICWKKGKDPHPQDKIQRLDFTKDPRPLYYKTPPCAFCTTNVSVVRPFSVLSKDKIGP